MSDEGPRRTVTSPDRNKKERDEERRKKGDDALSPPRKDRSNAEEERRKKDTTSPPPHERALPGEDRLSPGRDKDRDLTASNRSRIHKKRDQLPATAGGSSTAANGRIESPQAVFGASSPTEGITELTAATPPPPRRDGPIVQLNVGGKCFDTTIETLTVRDPSSMLGRMFSGQMGNRRDAEGRYFIDRDGTHFRYILNYLRDGTCHCPAAYRDEVLAEARFYQLQELITALEGKANTFAAHQLAAKAMNVLRNRKGNDISQLREHLLSEFGRQAGSGTLTPVVAIYSTENSKLYRDASDPDIRHIVITDLHQLGFKVTCQTTLSSAYAVHVFETSLAASAKHEMNEKLNTIIEQLKSVISTDGYGGKVVKTSTRPTAD